VRIGRLAAQAGFSVRTIRFYEQMGILPCTVPKLAARLAACRLTRQQAKE
jgi:DNA-binding transcriptional MerR regulator